MKRLIIVSIILLLIIPCFFAEDFEVMSIQQGESGFIQWTENGIDWINTKKGDIYTEYTGLALPAGATLVLSVKGKKQTIKGAINTLVKDAVKKDSMVSSVMSKLHSMMFANSDVKEASSRSIDSSTNNAFFYGDFPEIKSDEEIASVSLYQADFKEPLLKDEVFANHYDFTEYDLSEIAASNSNESFRISVKFVDSQKEHIIYISFINDSEYAAIIEYSSFENVVDWLFSSQKYIKKNRVKNFIGHYTINL